MTLWEMISAYGVSKLWLEKYTCVLYVPIKRSYKCTLSQDRSPISPASGARRREKTLNVASCSVLTVIHGQVNLSS